MNKTIAFMKSQLIKISNWTIVLISLFLLIKTSSSPYIFEIEKNNLIHYLLKPFKLFNNEISSLSASVLAAYIFYLVNNYMPDRKKNKEYKAQISPHVEKIIDKISKIFRIINEHSNLYIKFPVSNYAEIENIAKNIKFEEQYRGSLVFHPNNTNTVNYETVEYHIFHNAQDCLSKINELRTKNIIIDNILAKQLDTLEEQIKFTLTKYKLLMNSNDGFLNLIKIHSGIFNTSKEIMAHYNKHLKTQKGYSRADIWFNPDTINYADKPKAN